MPKFLGQGSNPYHSRDPRHSSDNAGSLTLSATRELLYLYSLKCCHAIVLTVSLKKQKKKQTSWPGHWLELYRCTWVFFSLSYLWVTSPPPCWFSLGFMMPAPCWNHNFPSGDCWVLRRESRGGLFQSRWEDIGTWHHYSNGKEERPGGPNKLTAKEKTSGLLWLCLWEVLHRLKGQQLTCPMALEHYMKLQK